MAFNAKEILFILRLPKFPVPPWFYSTSSSYILTNILQTSDDCHRGSKYGLRSHTHQHAYVNKLTVSSMRFVLLRSADQNGCCARSVTEIIFEARSTARELVATPTAISAIAEADVVGSRQAISTRGGNTCCSAIVYATGTTAEVVDFLGAVCNHCV